MLEAFFEGSLQKINHFSGRFAGKMVGLRTWSTPRTCLLYGRRQVRRLGADLWLFQVTGEGAVLLLVTNGAQEVTLRITCEVKVMTARAFEGLLVAQKEEEKAPQARAELL